MMTFGLHEIERPSDITCDRGTFMAADDLLLNCKGQGIDTVDDLRSQVMTRSEIMESVRCAALGILDGANQLGCLPRLETVVSLFLKSDDFKIRGMGERVREILDGEKKEFFRDRDMAKRVALLFSHIVNNKLQVFSANVSYIQEQLASLYISSVQHGNFEGPIKDVIQSSLALQEMTAELARFASISCGKKSVVDYSHETHGAIRNEIGAIPVQYHGPSHLMGVCDSQSFEHALRHLIRNARESLENNAQPVIDVSLEEVVLGGKARIYGLSSGSYVRLVVTDNGPGISDDVKLSALKPFVTTKASSRHLGLGLSHAANFVYAHDGAIYIDTKAGENSYTAVSLFVKQNEQDGVA